MLRKELHEQNRVAWNEATAAHNSHKIDQARFFREGGSTLYPEDIALLGDITGLSLVHLQCNAGQDTLSLARLGATVLGVDISDEAIAFARRLSEESGIPATFERADIYDWFDAAIASGHQFDMVYVSYGALVWLSDINAWGRGIAGVLKPGGRLALIDFHPFASTFGWEWEREAPYFSEGRAYKYDDGIGDYVAISGEFLAPMGYQEGVADFKNPHPVHEFNWGIGEVVTALTDAGLVITALREYPYSNGARLFNDMRETPEGRMYPPERVLNLPLMYGLVAKKLL